MLLKLWWKMTGNAVCLFVLHRVTSNVSLRVTLLLLAVSVGQVSAGADCDLQTGGVGVEGQSQLQFSGHRNALKAELCAGAAAAALREPNTGYSINFTLQRKRMREVWERIIIRGDFLIRAVISEYFNHWMLFGDFILLFFNENPLWLTLFPPEYSEPNEVSSSAPVDEPSWSLSLLFLNRFGRLGTLKSCTKKESHFLYSASEHFHMI